MSSRETYNVSFTAWPFAMINFRCASYFDIDQMSGGFFHSGFQPNCLHLFLVSYVLQAYYVLHPKTNYGPLNYIIFSLLLLLAYLSLGERRDCLVTIGLKVVLNFALITTVAIPAVRLCNFLPAICKSTMKLLTARIRHTIEGRRYISFHSKISSPEVISSRRDL